MIYLLICYKEELDTLINLNITQKIRSFPEYNSKILKESLLKFIDFKIRIIWYFT